MKKIWLFWFVLLMIGCLQYSFEAAEIQWQYLTDSNAWIITDSQPQVGEVTYFGEQYTSVTSNDWYYIDEIYQLVLVCENPGLYEFGNYRLISNLEPGVRIHQTPRYIEKNEAIYDEKVTMEVYVPFDQEFTIDYPFSLKHDFDEGTYYYFEFMDEGDFAYSYGGTNFHFYVDLSDPVIEIDPFMTDLEMVSKTNNVYLYRENGPSPGGYLLIRWKDALLEAFGYEDGYFETQIFLKEGVNSLKEYLPFAYLDLPVYEIDTQAPLLEGWQKKMYVSQVPPLQIKENNLDVENSYVNVNDMNYLGQTLPQESMHVEVHLVDELGHVFDEEYQVILDKDPPTYQWIENQLVIFDENLDTFWFETYLDGNPIAFTNQSLPMNTEGNFEINGWIRDLAGNQTDVHETIALDFLAPRIDFEINDSNLNVKIDDRYLAEKKICLTQQDQVINNMDDGSITLLDGKYELFVWAIDQFGHESQIKEKVIVDTQAPIFHLEQWKTIYDSHDIVLNGWMEDLHPAKAMVTLYRNDQYFISMPFEKQGIQLDLPDGDYLLLLKLEDTLGHASQYQHVFQVLTNPPEITLLVDGVILNSSNPLELATDVNVEMHTNGNLSWRVYRDDQMVDAGNQTNFKLERNGGIYHVEVDSTDILGRTTSKNLMVVMDDFLMPDFSFIRTRLQQFFDHSTNENLIDISFSGVIIFALVCIGWQFVLRIRTRKRKTNLSATEK